MLKNILTVLRKLASAAMNFLIVYFETIAVPMSWAMGGTIMFTMYTELSNIFNGAVCLLVGLWQLGCIFTGRELPLWLKRLKFISTSCLAMTFLTVVIILAPMYEDGNGWYIMLFTGSMLYHHFLNPVLAILSLVLFERLPRLPLRQVWWALESNNVPVVAACRAGVCGCCKTKVVSGEYTVSSTMTLTDAEIAEGYVLACSCHPQGDLVLA